jgi:hypothetical protein
VEPPRALSQPITDLKGLGVAGVESAVDLMFRPTRLLASTFANGIKAQQQVWAAITGGSGHGRAR